MLFGAGKNISRAVIVVFSRYFPILPLRCMTPNVHFRGTRTASMGPEVVIEDPAIVRLNIKRYQHLLEAESDPAKRQQILALFQEAKDAQSGLATSAQRLFAARVWTTIARPPTARTAGHQGQTASQHGLNKQ